MTSTIVPINIAVVYKFMCKLVFGWEHISHSYSTSIPKKLHENLSKFYKIGLPSEKEMAEFADTYNFVVTERNFTAHSTTGDDIIRCLPYMSETVRNIITYAFPVIFNCSIHDWESASEQKKSQRIYNCMLTLLSLPYSLDFY